MVTVNHGHVYPRPDGAKARCGGPELCRQCRRERMGIEVPAAGEIRWPGPETPEWVRATIAAEPAMPYADLRDLEAVERADVDRAWTAALIEHDRYLDNEYFELRAEQDAAAW